MRTNRAMFRSNGRCGYILKPSHLRSKSGIEEIKRRELTSDQSTKKTGGSSKKSKASERSLKSSSAKSKKGNEDQTRIKDYEQKKEEEPALEASLEEEEKEEDEEEEERVKITVISGQTMQRPKSGHQGEDDDVVDPYVEVKLFGEPNEKQNFKTKYIKNNGKKRGKEK